MTDNKEPWHLDKRVPITLVAMLFIQTAGLFYWGGQMESRVDTLEYKDTIQESRQDILEKKVDGQASLLARLDERTGDIKEDIKEIKDVLKKQ